MKTFKSACGKCHGLIDVPSSYIGKHVKCPNCAEDFIAEPHLGPAVKATKINNSSKPKTSPKSDKYKGINTSGFSLKVTEKELIFYRYCSFIGKLSIVFAVLSFAYWLYLIISPGNEKEKVDSLKIAATLTASTSLLISGAIHLGAAQIFRLFHSMAFNIQAIKERNDDTH